MFQARRPGTGGGSKIGLFVVRAVAEAQDGRAWATVDDGRLTLHLEPARHVAQGAREGGC